MKKVKIFSPRACRLNGVKLTPEFKIEHDTISSIQKDLSIWIYEKICKKEIAEINDKYIKFKNKAWDDWSKFSRKTVQELERNRAKLKAVKVPPRSSRDILKTHPSHREKRIEFISTR